jgi:Spy/CpxP family protein refolding chaperone
MKKIMLSATALLFTISIFAQTNSTPPPASKDAKGKTNAVPSKIAVSDPGAPAQKTVAPAPAPAPSAPAKEADKGKHKAKGHHKK